MSTFTLTELQYSEDRKGPWRLYIYNNHGYHSGAVWFSLTPNLESVHVTTARALAQRAIARGQEVRVTDGGDMLVYHHKDGEVKYGENFWKDIAGKEE